MPEGNDKPKSDDRAATLRRKLAGDRAGALGKQPTGAQTPVALKQAATNPPPSSKRNPPTTSPPPSTTPPPSAEKDAVLAARRALVGGTTRPPPASIRPLAPAKDKKTRPIFLVLGGLLTVALLVIGGLYAKQMLEERTPEGQFRAQLMSWEFAIAPGERENIHAALDREAPGSLTRAIALLNDSSTPERSDSKSERTMQALAHLYLVHYASVVKAPPPPAANDVVTKMRGGQPVSPDMWNAARDGWTKWLSEQQSKGKVPK
jgi:hypothetical protein